MKYLIIGLGVFGGSAAIEIAKKDASQVTAVDDGSELAASRDLFKFVRTDYANTERMKQAMHVHHMWMSRPFFRKFYTQTGRVAIYFPNAMERLAAIDKSRATLGLPIRPRFTRDSRLPSHGLDEKFAQLVRTVTAMESDNDATFVYNDDDGVVSWHEYMNELENMYREQGVEVRNLSVERLIVEDYLVKSVELSLDESIDTADVEVLVAAGSWTVPLLQSSGITLPQLSRLPVPTGVFTIHLELNHEQLEATKSVPPISVYGMDTPYADGGEYFPPNKRGVAKIGWTLPHRNENPMDSSNSKLALQALAGARCFTERFIPQLKGAEVIKICSLWDGITSTQAPIIARHPELRNLTIASGGSFNYAKDAPEIGATILNVMNGHHEPAFSWEPQLDGGQNQPHLITERTFNELEVWAKESCGDPVGGRFL